MERHCYGKLVNNVATTEDMAVSNSVRHKKKKKCHKNQKINAEQFFNCNDEHGTHSVKDELDFEPEYNHILKTDHVTIPNLAHHKGKKISNRKKNAKEFISSYNKNEPPDEEIPHTEPTNNHMLRIEYESISNITHCKRKRSKSDKEIAATESANNHIDVTGLVTNLVSTHHKKTRKGDKQKTSADINDNETVDDEVLDIKPPNKHISITENVVPTYTWHKKKKKRHDKQKKYMKHFFNDNEHEIEPVDKDTLNTEPVDNHMNKTENWTILNMTRQKKKHKMKEHAKQFTKGDHELELANKEIFDTKSVHHKKKSVKQKISPEHFINGYNEGRLESLDEKVPETELASNCIAKVEYIDISTYAQHRKKKQKRNKLGDNIKQFFNDSGEHGIKSIDKNALDTAYANNHIAETETVNIADFIPHKEKKKSHHKICFVSDSDRNESESVIEILDNGPANSCTSRTESVATLKSRHHKKKRKRYDKEQICSQQKFDSNEHEPKSVIEVLDTEHADSDITCAAISNFAHHSISSSLYHKKKKQRKTISEDECIDSSLRCQSNFNSDAENDSSESDNDILETDSDNVHTSLGENCSFALIKTKDIKKYPDILDSSDDPVNFEIPMLHESERLTTNSKAHESLIKQGAKFGKWTKQEDSILLENWARFIEQFKISDPVLLFGLGLGRNRRKNKIVQKFIRAKHFYVRLGEGLNNRLLRSIIWRAKRLLDPRRNLPKLDKNDYANMKQMCHLTNRNWTKIGKHFQLANYMCSNRLRWYEKPVNKGNWSKEEEQKFNEAIKEILDVSEIPETLEDIPWKNIAKLVGSRNSMQCRNHWYYSISCKKNLPPIIRWDKGNRKKLLKILKDTYSHVGDAVEVDWKHVYESFQGCVPSSAYLRRKYKVIASKIPASKKNNFRDAIDFLCAKYHV